MSILSVKIIYPVDYEIVDGRKAKEYGTLDQSSLDHRILSEDNEIAGTMCRMLAIFLGPIGKAIYSFVLLTMGIGGYTGKLQPGAIFTFAFGGIIIFAGINLLDLIIPGYGIKSGCGCKEKVIIGREDFMTVNTSSVIDSPGNEVFLYTTLPLTKDCKRKAS